MIESFIGIAKQVSDYELGEKIPQDIARKFSNKIVHIEIAQNLFNVINGIVDDPSELFNVLPSGKWPKKHTDRRWSLRINDTFRICFTWNSGAYEVGIVHKRNVNVYL